MTSHHPKMVAVSMSISALFLLLLLQLSESQQRVDQHIGDESVESSAVVRRISSDSNSTRRRHQTCLICDVTVADVQYEFNQSRGVDDFLVCMTIGEQEPDGSTNQVYRLDQLPKAFVRQYKQQLYSGRYRICIPKGRASRTSNQVVIPNATDLELMPADTNHRRSLASKTGVHTVLVVRVTSTVGEDPGLTAEQLQGSIFGTGPSPELATLKSQFAACSLGNLIMTPATGNNVVNGVLDVQHVGQISGGSIVGSLQTAILQETKAQLGINDLSQAADHVMFCLPSGSKVTPNNDKWIAFSYLNKWLSFFQNGWCQRLSAQVHEISHQIGFRHSGMGKLQYGDYSCVMGASYGVTGRPQMCFNGHKNWYSGWFENSKITVDPIPPFGAWVGNLVAFVDVPLMKQIPNSVSIINVGDLFIELNSAKKYNYQVVAQVNKVTVVQNNSTSLWSNMLVGLSGGQKYTFANYSGLGIGLVVDVCFIHFGTIDYAKVSLYLNDGVQTSKCSKPLTLPPAAIPSPAPTSLPTHSLPPAVQQLNLTAPQVITFPEGLCFSEINTVEVKHKGVISIRDLQIGDFVKAADGSFDLVYSFGHYQHNTKADYLQIFLQGRRQPIEISEDHLLFVGKNAIPASLVTIGTEITLGNGGTAKATKIKAVSRSGAYAPFTLRGTIVVSGVTASSYVSLQKRSHVLMVGQCSTPVTMHWLGHVFQSPHRLVCYISATSCKSESYSAEGISSWVEGPFHGFQWLLQQHWVIIIMILAPALLAVLVICAIEVLFFESGTSLYYGAWCLSFAVILLTWHLGKNRKLSR